MTWTHEIATNSSGPKMEKWRKVEKATTRVFGHFHTFHRAVACTLYQIKMQENVSILETIVADMPDLFYSEILPKIELAGHPQLGEGEQVVQGRGVERGRRLVVPGKKLEAHFAKVKVLAVSIDRFI